MSQQPRFTVTAINLIKLDGHFTSHPKEKKEYNQSYRIALDILNDKTMIVLFGISLQSREGEKNISVAGVIAEVAATIEMDTPLSEISELADVPLIANVLALIFPFLREKVHYFFSNNQINIVLLPLNTVELVKASKDARAGGSVSISDRRKIQ